MQTFNFDNVQEGDEITRNSVTAVFTKTKRCRCSRCPFYNCCISIPCHDGYYWKKVSNASWNEVTDEKKRA